jgi:peptide methionine sulfoxide reductase MsrA
MQLRKNIEDKIKELTANKVCKSYCYRGKTSYGFYAEDYHQDYVKTIPISLM